MNPMISLLRVLPQNQLSRLAGGVARLPLPPALWQPAIRLYARAFDIDLAEVAEPLPSFRTLADFFLRQLKPSCRPLDPDPANLLSPVDGAVRSGGPVRGGVLEQVKGIDYRLEDLLLDPERTAAFRGGEQLTLYLSPRDYHRVHSPLGGKVTGYQYVPGRLFPVNGLTIDRVPALFTVNERLTTYLQTGVGQVAVVMVGAMVVGRMRVTYDDVRSNRGGVHDHLRGVQYRRPIPLERGAELGCFELGSTVVLLFEPGRVALDPLAPGARVRFGERIGRAQ